MFTIKYRPLITLATAAFLTTCTPKSVEETQPQKISLDSVIEVSDTTFANTVLESDIPVVVDFYAEWCPPCRAYKPVFHKVSDDYKGKVKFTAMNVDDNTTVEKEYGINCIPTTLLFDDGKMVKKEIGYMSEEELKEFIDSYVEE